VDRFVLAVKAWKFLRPLLPLKQTEDNNVPCSQINYFLGFPTNSSIIRMFKRSVSTPGELGSNCQLHFFCTSSFGDRSIWLFSMALL